jgi:hypothetical protein
MKHQMTSTKSQTSRKLQRQMLETAIAFIWNIRSVGHSCLFEIGHRRGAVVGLVLEILPLVRMSQLKGAI